MGKPKNTRHTRKYLIIFFDTLTRTRPATRYFAQYPTRPDTEKPYPLGTDNGKVKIANCPAVFLTYFLL